MKYYLDTELLAAMIRNKRGKRGLREVSSTIENVSPSTLSRVENGKMPDMETFLALCSWLEVSPNTLIQSQEDKQPTISNLDAPEALAIQLRADKNLEPATANALAELVKAAYDNLPKRNDDAK